MVILLTQVIGEPGATAPSQAPQCVNLCLIVMYVRHAEPGQWHGIEDAMSAGQGARDVQSLLRSLGNTAQETLRRHGDRTDMRSSLLQLEPRSWDDLATAVRTAASTGTGAFQLVWEAFSAREGLQSSEFCSPMGLASLSAALVLTPGQKMTVLDPYMRGGEMLAAAYRHIGGAQGTVHGVDVVLTNPPFDMSDAPGPGRRTGTGRTDRHHRATTISPGCSTSSVRWYPAVEQWWSCRSRRAWNW